MATSGVIDSAVLLVLQKRTSLMSVKDVANVTGLSGKTIYRRAKAGTMPCIKLGLTLKFDPQQLERWLRGHYAA